MRKILLSALGAGAMLVAWLKTNLFLVALAATKYGVASVSFWGLRSENPAIAKLSMLGMGLSGLLAGFIIWNIIQRILKAHRKGGGILKIIRILLGIGLALAGFWGFTVTSQFSVLRSVACLLVLFIGLGLAFWDIKPKLELE